MRNADIVQPYGGYFVEPNEGKRLGFKPIGNFTKEQVIADKKHKAAIWFVSNCRSQERLDVANGLKR